MELKKMIIRGLRGLWQGIKWTRQLVYNVITVMLLVLLIVGLLSPSGPDVPKSAILVFHPQGDILEQVSGDPLDKLSQQATGEESTATLLWDVLDAIKAAKDDHRVKALFLELNDMGDARLTSLEAIKGAIQDFKTSGKKVIAAADNYGYQQYYLAAQADEVLLHRLGVVVLEGLGRYRSFYKEGLDRLEVEMNIIRVGEYKSAAEPFLRNDMSPEDRQASVDWMGDLWQSAINDMAAARKLKPEELHAYTANAKDTLRSAQGDGAKAAMDARLVDRLVTRSDIRARLIEIAGEDEKKHTFHQVDVSDYLASTGKDRTEAPGADNVVGVVVAAGEIKDGEQPPGTIGGESTAAIIRRARTDKNIKAMVLRVDSPGGSAFASEVIREECVKAREAGKPVVVSMGGVAASGGYWISTASDEIFASPNTITGSIGIFSILPTFDKPLAKHLGVHVDGVGTTWLAGAYRPDKALHPDLKDVMQQLIQHGYREFLAHVSQARKMSVEDVDKIARGRVWSGADAQRIGLVDQLGDLSAAIASAAKRANLGEDYKVRFVEKELTWQEQMARNALSSVIRYVGPSVATAVHKPGSQRVLERMMEPMEKMLEGMARNGVVSFCLECVPE